MYPPGLNAPGGPFDAGTEKVFLGSPYMNRGARLMGRIKIGWRSNRETGDPIHALEAQEGSIFWWGDPGRYCIREKPYPPFPLPEKLSKKRAHPRVPSRRWIPEAHFCGGPGEGVRRTMGRKGRGDTISFINRHFASSLSLLNPFSPTHPEGRSMI